MNKLKIVKKGDTRRDKAVLETACAAAKYAKVVGISKTGTARLGGKMEWSLCYICYILKAALGEIVASLRKC